MNTKCKKTRHRCSSDKKCYRKSLWVRKNLIKRCKVGTRKCRDNKCHKKKFSSVKHNSTKAISARSNSSRSNSSRSNSIKLIQPLKALTNNMMKKISSTMAQNLSSRASKKIKRPPWR